MKGRATLLKAAGSVGSMTFVSRILGFVRDVAFATLFGAGMGMDAFLVAFKVPNFFRRLFGEGALRQSVVPVLSDTRTNASEAEAADLVNAASGTLAVVLLGVTVVGVLAAPGLVYVFAPGFSDDASQFHLTSQLLRLTFPYLLFISLVALAGAVLNTYQRFAVPAFTPVLLNVCLILAAVFAAPLLERPELALAIGVLVAGAAQLGFQLPFLARIGCLPRPRWAWRDLRVQRILKLMLPIIFGASVTQINLLVNTVIASLLAAGSVSWLYYADRLMEFPLGVFSIAIATVILPNLSARHAEASTSGFAATMDWALKLLVLLGMPAMLGLFMLAGPLVTTLFGYHSFTPHDARMSAYALMAYALGFMGFSFVKVLVTGFFSRQDSRTPVRCGVIAMSSAMLLNVVFVLFFQWRGWTAPHAGLALATSAGAFLNAGLLYYYLRKSGVYVPGRDWLGFLCRVALACGAMTVVLAFGGWDWSRWLARPLALRIGWLAAWIAIGAAVYFAVLFVSGWRPRQLQRVEISTG
ncbi:murein biosynthesis integral membrane protein MurJ [Salinisphaera sp. USBA-960]|uniref:murein biosynthesis integral membrane protein MurJ n=1 Tax=Salinisphaera orenii TaxID=856731 RepID=UPI000DBE0B29|nr:murein biosynthesis integral membrane protein MurJ [Salifodinibacter halophilus]NNC25746.1 murein biosynthesis integral membrane protein MurJ [Salifodinibacter halophilus]